MKTSTIIAVTLAAPAAAFSGSSFTGSAMKSVKNSATMTMEYIPSGMSKKQWAKVKEKEAAKKGKKDLGKTGITSFKSRSFDDWQKSGGKNLFPVDPNKVKGSKEIPYMQRKGGSADDADLEKDSGGGFFGMFNKKKPEPEPEPEPPKKRNPWTF
mmetsp:Transcript_1476/g.1586  ORF Transcript_1476/g.1586 Transcript_1476/m.1586 type:complete len:155 (-) Transcript_1476:217-681(-)|eukprot:CAMPEP_0198260022 /NCGR_PEP_ID=MMETSP1447-20131203/9068_1 /TAXON_ID=420782 /ORGANISM="Chaetoceros dichaeta, Strain CCMP1751" /LENGTH=154 /DNA_ID=CAMNT_0043947565 /DNA_START=128 /DNA_END=592 /DNA_ORIENTATION=+